jgi:deoxyribonuclease IV
VNERIRLGFHLSIAGALANAPVEAHNRNYDAFQIFTTSARSWKNSTIGSIDKDNFMKSTNDNDLKAFAHIPYLCNPASPNQPVYEKSKEMLVNNIRNCELLGIDSLVIHLGSHLDKGMSVGIENICAAVSAAIDSTNNVKILLENGSGYKNCVGSKFSDIAEIIDRVGSERVGVCFDTCHAFAAGYDLSSIDAVDKTMGEFSDCIKLSRLGLIHLNDAKYPLASGLDRHFHIGKGNIGRNGFIALFKNKAFSNGSFIMELPEDEEGSHLDDIRAIQSIIKEASE